MPPGCSADCDCDGDGVQAETCGGGDCDDDDPNVFAGQDTYFPTPSLRRQFDYDCNGTSDPDPALDRRVDCTLGLVNCDEAQQGYFANAPACGVAAPWGRCKRGTLLCEQNVLDNRVMQCK